MYSSILFYSLLFIFLSSFKKKNYYYPPADWDPQFENTALEKLLHTYVKMFIGGQFKVAKNVRKVIRLMMNIVDRVVKGVKLGLWH